MKNIKVTFYPNDGRRNCDFTAIFTNDRILDDFLSEYQNFGGHRQFNYDIWEEDCTEKLPRLSVKYEHFKKIYNTFFPNIEMQRYNPLPL